MFQLIFQDKELKTRFLKMIFFAMKYSFLSFGFLFDVANAVMCSVFLDFIFSKWNN